MRAVALLVVLLAPGALAEAASAPKLAVGDFFEMRDTITEPGGSTQERTWRDTVVALEPVVVNGTTYDAVRIDTVLGMPQTGASGTITRWIRASDGALLRMRTESSGTFMGEAPQTSTSETTFDAPCIHLVFPLVVGAEWTSACASTVASASGDRAPSTHRETRTTRYRVLGEEEVTVPAGTFSAILFESNTTENPFAAAPMRHWYADAACTIVRTVEPQTAGYSDTYDLMSYRCASIQGGSARIPAAPLALLLLGIAALARRRRTSA